MKGFGVFGNFVRDCYRGHARLHALVGNATIISIRSDLCGVGQCGCVIKRWWCSWWCSMFLEIEGVFVECDNVAASELLEACLDDSALIGGLFFFGWWEEEERFKHE